MSTKLVCVCLCVCMTDGLCATRARARTNTNSQVAPPGGGSVIVPVTFQQLHSGRVLHLGSKHMCSWLLMWELLFHICLTAVLTHALRSKRSQITSVCPLSSLTVTVCYCLHDFTQETPPLLPGPNAMTHTRADTSHADGGAAVWESGSSDGEQQLLEEFPASWGECMPLPAGLILNQVRVLGSVSVLMSLSTPGTRCEHVLRPGLDPDPELEATEHRQPLLIIWSCH